MVRNGTTRKTAGIGMAPSVAFLCHLEGWALCFNIFIRGAWKQTVVCLPMRAQRRGEPICADYGFYRRQNKVIDRE